MHHFIILHCTSLLFLLTMGKSTPPPVDKMKNNVKMLGETALIRIQKFTNEFQISPNMVFSGAELIPNITLETPLGLSSVAENLNTFQLILLNLTLDGTLQIRSDIVGLLDIVHWLAASSSCPMKKPASDGHLETFLKTNMPFQLSIANIVLTRLQEFLNKLINNLDQLKKC
ncbi:leptin-like [Anguilla rostrata]|uniref:Leptin n=1 Tax=Anguilla anguilla TaxID=7936 RepID=A0A0C7AV58_ANGAN|nr:leptin-like [Anguilla anguilla]XP_035283417.1 leptin-like [Anguilla anguilla]CEE15395.1 Leptin1 [Anguilla anguilla]